MRIHEQGTYRTCLAFRGWINRMRKCINRPLAVPTGLRRAVLSIVMAVMILPAAGYGANQPDTEGQPDLTNLSVEELLTVEIDTVQGASGFKQKVTEAPSAVTVVTADEIKKFGYRTLADVLKSVRGFYVFYDRNYHYAGIRGFGRPGDYNTRVLVLLDGFRMNDNMYDTGAIGTEFPVDIDLIERIEIIRGPSSSLYGSNAFMGVINVQTKHGRDYKTVEVSGEAGSHETFKGRASYGNDFKGGPEVLLSGTYFNSRGQKSLHFPEFDDPATNNGNAVNLDGDRSRNSFAKLSYDHYTLTALYGKRDKDIPTASFGTIFNDPEAYSVDRTAVVNLQYSRLFDSQWEILARLTYSSYDYSGGYPYDYPPRTINRDETTGNWWGTEIRLSRALFEKHRLTMGGEFRNNFKQDQKNFDVDPYLSYLDDKRDSTVWAAYVQDEISLFKNLLLNVGVRYDRYSTFGGTTNPRLGLIYKPFDDTILKLLYGSAFRTPNSYELYYAASGSNKSNPDLDPETIRSYEFVAEQYWGRFLSGSASLFYYKIKDLISQQTDPADGFLVFNNTDEIEARGVEVELNGKWNTGFQGQVSYTYQDTENAATGDNLTNAPKHLAKAKIIIPIIGEKLFLGLEEQFTGSRKTLGGSTADSYFITNVTLFSQNIVRGLEVSGSIYNLFDKEYGDPGSEEHIQNILKQDGRIFRVKATYRF